MRPAALAVCALALALALSGCETTAEKSARLERAAKRSAGGGSAQRGPTFGRPSAFVTVARAVIVHGPEGSAVVVTLHNDSASARQGLPLEIQVTDARGAVVYTNAGGGVARSLSTAPVVSGHGEASWVDDQVPVTSAGATVTAKVGEGAVVEGAIPAISTTGTRLAEDPANGLGAEGTATNHSRVAQRELVVNVVARRGGRVVAAGRSVLPELTAGASTRYQAFFVGDPRGAQLLVSAPPSTLR